MGRTPGTKVPDLQKLRNEDQSVHAFEATPNYQTALDLVVKFANNYTCGDITDAIIRMDAARRCLRNSSGSS